MEKEPDNAQLIGHLENEGETDVGVVDSHEHVVNIEDQEVTKEITEAKNLFTEFLHEYADKFDLSDPESIDVTLEAAREKGIFGAAEKIRNLIYDRNISIYGVSYLSNVCNENCRFCPMGVANWDIYQTRIELQNPELPPEDREQKENKVKAYEESLKTMNKEEAKRDFAALAEVGHQEICVLSGEEISANPAEVIDYVQLALDTPGIKEVILNIGAYNAKVFRMIRENLMIPPGKTLQHRIFQETYDVDEYAKFTKHAPKGGTIDMPGKYYWIERRTSQGEALKGGFDEVGIGALFGLTKYPLKEIAGLQKHAEAIAKLHGKEPKRCCLPFGNEPEYLHVDIPFMVPGKEKAAEIIELTYALARLAMPTVSIVSSERDEPEILKKLDKYANHTTLFVHPGPGRNIESLTELNTAEKSESGVIEQAKTTSRQPREAILDWLERGYHVIDFDWGRYLTPEEIAKY